MGKPEPFLLDAGYRGTLDSEAFRGRFRSVNGADVPGSLAVAAIALLFALVWLGLGPAFIVLAFVLRKPDLAFIAIPLTPVGLLMGGVILFMCRGAWKRNALLRRLAREGRLVPGALLDCKGEYSVDEGMSCYMVTVRYRGVAPCGKEVEGTEQRNREDHYEKPLPDPGTPVVVLTLPDGSAHHML
jgi:hypothetical protein